MPAANKTVTIITYNGIDGACAAAMALLKYPKAKLISSSARSIGETFDALRRQPIDELHVCGLGVYCDWDALEAPALAMKRKRVKIFWHCGRGYLSDKAEDFRAFATPVFVDAGTNTSAVGQHFGVLGGLEAQALMELAEFDRNVEGCRTPQEASHDQTDWLDLIHAYMSHYFKYQDRQPYLDVIRKLSKLEFDGRDRQAVEMFRRNGYRYLLHGDTPALRKLKDRIKRCADANRHVIVTGESGVGKEHVAHLFWERSPRAMGPLVAVNCALYAGNANIANSDLFGHKKGAFTGADKDRRGRFVEANNGILFLDELAELPLEVQAKLLRVLEDGRVTPLGADQYEQEVDVLILAATNRNLPQRIREGHFRADLYHRLATLRIEVPPLRERKEDIRLIVEQRLELLAGEGRPRQLGRADYKALTSYDWPGNVRQLIKLVERAVLLEMSIQEAIEEERTLGELLAVPDGVDGELLLPRSQADIRPMEEIQAAYARRAWELHGESYSAAAKALGVAENTLRYGYLKK